MPGLCVHVCRWAGCNSSGNAAANILAAWAPLQVRSVFICVRSCDGRPRQEVVIVWLNQCETTGLLHDVLQAASVECMLIHLRTAFNPGTFQANTRKATGMAQEQEQIAKRDTDKAETAEIYRISHLAEVQE